MTIFFARYVCEELNCVKNISLYDLSINFNTRVKEYNIKMKYNNLRLYDAYIKALTLIFINIRVKISKEFFYNSRN